MNEKTRERLESVMHRIIANVRRFEEQRGAPIKYRFACSSYNNLKRQTGVDIGELIDFMNDENLIVLTVSYRGSRFLCTPEFLKDVGPEQIEAIVDTLARDPNYLNASKESEATA